MISRLGRAMNPSVSGYAAMLAGALAGGLALYGCGEPATTVGQAGPMELGPRAGQYFVGEFAFNDNCTQPPFALSGARATARSAVFTLQPGTDHDGSVELTGTFFVPDPNRGAPPIPIFEGPDTGDYRIRGDTLRLRFGKRPNDWVGIVHFTQFRGGVLAGGSGTPCSSALLRLQRLP